MNLAKRKLMGAIILGSAVVSFARGARAASPAPLVSDACHHLLPNNAHIHHPSGEVFVDGQLVATYPDSACSGGTTQTGGWTGWAEDIRGNAIASGTGGYNHLQSTPEYDKVISDWQVPSLPTHEADASFVALFNGTASTGGVLLQPILHLEPGTSSNWYFTSEATNCVLGGSGSCWDDQVGAPGYSTTPGHVMVGATTLTSGSLASGTETWTIVTTDSTNGNQITLTETLSGFGAFNATYHGVLEVHDLANCDALPASNTTNFTSIAVYQCGDSTNGGAEAYVATTPAQPWFGEFGSGSLSCSWGVADSSPGGTTATLNWTN